MSDPFGSVESFGDTPTLTPEVSNIEIENKSVATPANLMDESPVEPEPQFESSQHVSDSIDFTQEHVNGRVAETGGMSDNVGSSDSDLNLPSSVVETDSDPNNDAPQLFSESDGLIENDIERYGRDDSVNSLADENNVILDSSDPTEFLDQFETNEATPPPTPPAAEPEVLVSPKEEPDRLSSFSTPPADTTTPSSSGDGPVKMPKATTISPPTKIQRNPSSPSKLVILISLRIKRNSENNCRYKCL